MMGFTVSYCESAAAQIWPPGVSMEIEWPSPSSKLPTPALDKWYQTSLLCDVTN